VDAWIWNVLGVFRHRIHLARVYNVVADVLTTSAISDCIHFLVLSLERLAYHPLSLLELLLRPTLSLAVLHTLKLLLAELAGTRYTRRTLTVERQNIRWST
jgi:hypothetical protein